MADKPEVIWNNDLYFKVKDEEILNSAGNVVVAYYSGNIITFYTTNLETAVTEGTLARINSAVMGIDFILEVDETSQY